MTIGLKILVDLLNVSYYLSGICPHLWACGPPQAWVRKSILPIFNLWLKGFNVLCMIKPEGTTHPSYLPHWEACPNCTT